MGYSAQGKIDRALNVRGVKVCGAFDYDIAKTCVNFVEDNDDVSVGCKYLNFAACTFKGGKK
jgi:hypothetical protein